MAVKTDNVFINTAKTYKVERLLPNRSVGSGWKAAYGDSTLTASEGMVPKWNYPGGSATEAAAVQLNLKSTKPGETQYVTNAKDGLSAVACVKVGSKKVPDVYGYSVLDPEKLANKIPGVQVLVSLEELFRASRITKIVPGSGSDPETYECNDQTGHLPITGWLCVRVPKHMAVTEELLSAYMCDLFGSFTANGTNAGTSFTKQIMSLATGDVLL